MEYNLVVCSDKSKAQLLRNNSIPSIVHVMQTDKVRETLSHIACAIANLATNGTDFFLVFLF